LLSSCSDDTAASSSSFFLPTGVHLLRDGNIYDATKGGQTHCPEAYSPECVEQKFSEVRMLYHGSVLEGQGDNNAGGAVERGTLTQAASVVAVLAVDRFWVPKTKVGK
jgi:hypothetical protein